VKVAEKRKRTDIEQSLQAFSNSPGRPIESAVREEMEQELGHDFSQVRVFDDASAAEVAEAFGAEAFAVGRSLFFGFGRYRPHTPEGHELLRHELSHTVQQRSARPAEKLEEAAPEAESRADAKEGEQPAMPMTVARRSTGISLDPARIAESLARIVKRNLRRDPNDTRGDVRRQLERLAPELREKMLDRLKLDLTDAEMEKVRELVHQDAPATDESPKSEEHPQEEAKAAPAKDDAEHKIEVPETDAKVDAPETEEAKEEGTNKETEKGDVQGEKKDDKVAAPKPEAKKGAEKEAPAKDGEEKKEENPEAVGETEKAEVEGGKAPVEEGGGATAAAPTEGAAGGATPTVDAGGGGDANPDASAVDKIENAVPPVKDEPAAPAGPENRQPASAEPAHTESAPAESANEEPTKEGSGPDKATDEAGAETEAEPASPRAEATGSLPDTPAYGDLQSAQADEKSQGQHVEEVQATPAGNEASASVAVTAPEPLPAPEPGPVQGGASPEVAGTAEMAPQEPAEAEASAPAPTASAPAPAPTTLGVPATAAGEPTGGGPAPEAAAGGPTASGPSAGGPAASGPSAEEPSNEAPVGAEPEAAEPAAGAQAVGPEAPASEAPAEGGAAVGMAPEAEAGAGGGGGEGGGGGGGCGGGGAPGGGATAEEPAAAAPQGGSDPEAVLAGAAGGTPVAIGGSLTAAQAAAQEGVGSQKGELESNPATMERPSGAPAGAVAASRDPGAPPAPPTVTKVEVGEAGAVQATETQAPSGDGPAIAAPRVSGNPEGKLTDSDVGNMAAAVDELPTTDPGLEVTAEAPATMQLDGAADPEQAETQRAHAQEAGAKAHEGAKADAMKPRGEQGIYPTIKPETLSGKPCPGAERNPKAAAPTGVCRNVAALAESEKGAETRASIGEAQSQMGEARTQQQENQEKEKADSDEKVQQSIDENTSEQTAARNEAQKEVADKREEWTEAQDKAVETAETDGTTTVTKVRKEIGDKKTETDKGVETDVTEGNRQIGEAKTKAEGDARDKKKEANGKSSGFFGWLADKVKSFFNAIKDAIKAAFKWARDQIKKALTWLRDKVLAAIEAARKWVVDKIRAIADAILAIADVLLAAFPGLRDKFHALIEKAVEFATNLVNKLADALKSAVSAFFDALMCALDALLGLLLDALLAAVDYVASAVAKAIEFAKAIADGLGQFIELVADVAKNPGGWISNLASSAAAGIKNCLWAAFKAAIKQWFNSKVEAVVGMGKAIWNLLMKGGISFAKIGKMAWEGIKAAIPMALVSIVIEKVVSMIIPAAGAVLLVIQGLIAAWGAIKRVLAALGLVWQYLKSVAGGGSPGLFAQAVAASAIVVIDFVANWLIARLAKGAGEKLAKAFQSLAKKLMATMKKIAGAVKKGAKAAAGAVKKAVTAVVKAVKKGVAKVVKAVKGLVKKVANSKAWKYLKNTKLGKLIAKGIQGIKNLYAKAKAKYQELKDRYKKWREKRKKDKGKNAEERLQKAVTAIKPPLTSLLDRGVSRVRLLAQLLYWRIRHRLSSLSVQGGGSSATVLAKINPESPVLKLIKAPTGQALLTILHRVGAEIMDTMGDEALTAIEDQRAKGAGASEEKPLIIQPGKGNIGAMRDVRENSSGKEKGEFQHMILKDGTAVTERMSVRHDNPTPGTIHVHGLGGRGSYPAIASNLERMRKDTGASEAEILQALAGLQKGHPIPKKFLNSDEGERNQRTFGALVRLIQVEGGRGDAAVLQGPMLHEMIKAKKITLNEAFTGKPITESGGGGGGAFPASQRGAVLGEHLVASEIGHEEQTRTTNTEAREDQKKRQIAYAARFVHLRMEVLDMDFESPDDVDRYVRKEMEKELHALAHQGFGLSRLVL